MAARTSRRASSGDTRIGRLTAKGVLLRTTDRRCATGRLARREDSPTEVGSVVPFVGHSTVVGAGVKAQYSAVRGNRQHRYPRRAQDTSPAIPRPRPVRRAQSMAQEIPGPISRGSGASAAGRFRRAGSRQSRISIRCRMIGSLLAPDSSHEPTRAVPALIPECPDGRRQDTGEDAGNGPRPGLPDPTCALEIR